MKASLSFLILFSFLSHSLFAGQSKLTPILWSPNILCCGTAQYSVEVENINPTFAIENINGTWVVTRQSQVIHQEVNNPRISDLQPGQKQTFVMEIPMELLLLDGLIEIFFEFGSDFDLNPDPTASLDAFVTGCGVTQAVASGLILAAMGAQAEEREAYIFLFQQLLKPGTIIRGSGTDIYTKQLVAFSWLAVIYNPLLRFGQPVQVAVLNSNTEEIEVIDADFPPIIFEQIYSPDIDSGDKIFGQLPPAPPPPSPFTFEEGPTMPADSVCAILVSGNDYRQTMQQGFNNDIDLMKKVLTQHNNGPRLPETSVLVRGGVSYTRDSLLMDIQGLKDKYKKVYFYYTGHGSSFGQMCIGLLNSDYLDYPTFVDALFDSGAKDYCIMIDACFAGKAVDAVSLHPEIENLNVEIIASSNNVKESSSNIWTIDSVNQWFGKFTNHFFWAMNNPDSDENMDGKISFFEGFTKVSFDNFLEITDKQCPVGKSINNNTITTIGQNVRQWALPIYGIAPLDHATIYVNPIILPAGTIVQPYDQSQSFILPASSYFSWIEWNANATFGKPVTYTITDPSTLNVTFLNDIEFWPTIPSFPGYNAFNEENIYTSGQYIIDSLPPVSITDPITEVDTVSKKLAIVVSGFHPRTRDAIAFQGSVSLFNENLNSEKLGDQFPQASIKTYTNVNGNQLVNIMSGFDQEYDKVFFYYAGNGTKIGTLSMGTDPADWLSYTDLLESIGAINSKGYKIFLDCSYSGQALQYIQETEVFNGKRLDVFTSTDAETPAFLEFYDDQASGLKFGVNFMTLRLMEHYGDPQAEQDGEEGTSHMEAFKRLFVQNPLNVKNIPLFNLSKPKATAIRYIDHTADSVYEESHRSLDLGIRIDFRQAAAIDVHAQQSLDVQDLSSADPHVFAISPVRQWKLNGTWEVDPAFTADLVFEYREGIDNPVGTEGILGLVSRATQDEDWTAWYPSQYDEVTHQITAVNVTDAREWAIAKVEEIVGVSDPIEGLTGIHVFPNPATERIQISFVLKEITEITFRIADLNGKVIYFRESKPFQAGEQHIEIELPDLVAGMYYVELADQQGRMYRPFVVK